MSLIQFTNQYPAELASDLTTAATTLVLKSGHGDNFPAIANGENKYFLVALVDKNGNREIIRIIQRASGTDTLVVGSSSADQPSGNVSGRAQEGTSALSITASDDHIIELRLTAGIMDALAGAIPATTAELQATTDPYPAGSPGLPTTLDGLIQRIKYLIAQITGETYWYIDPDISLATLATRSVPTGSIVLFESNTAVSGYTLLTTVDDYMVYIGSGSGAGGLTGAADRSGGTWTVAGLTAASHTHDLSNHTHTGPSHTHTLSAHTHTGPSHTHDLGNHTHAVSGNTGAEGSHTHTIPAGTLITQTSPDGNYATTTSAGSSHLHAVSITSGAPSSNTSGADGTGASGAPSTDATGAGGTGASGAPSNNTSGGNTAAVSSSGAWRPPGRVFTRQQKT